MPLGFSYSVGGSGDILPIIKWDAKAGTYFAKIATKQRTVRGKKMSQKSRSPQSQWIWVQSKLGGLACDRSA